MRRLFRGPIPLLLLCLAACSHGPAVRQEASLPKADKLTITITSNRQLELEPCGCTIAPLGGLEREWRALEMVRASGSPALLELNAGTAFVPPVASFDPKHKDYYIKKAGFLLEAMNDMGVSVLSPSAEDFALGMDTIKKLEKKADFSFISTNLYSKSKHEPLFPRYREFQVGEETVLVMGVTGDPGGGYPGIPEDVEVKPAAQAVKSVLAELPPKPRFVVLLSSLTPSEMKDLRKQVPEIQLALGGTHPEIKNDVQQLGRNFVYYTPLDRARNVAQIDIEVRKQINAMTSDAVIRDLKTAREGWKTHLAHAKAELSKKRKKKLSAFDRKMLEISVASDTENLENSAWIDEPQTDAAKYTFKQYVLDASLNGSENKMTDLIKRFKQAVREIAMSQDEGKEE